MQGMFLLVAITATIVAGPLSAGSLAAQLPEPTAPVPTAEAIARGAAAIDAADLSRHLAVLTADSMQGRVSGSRALVRAARYVAGQFRALGLQLRGGRIPTDIDSSGHTLPDSSWFFQHPIPGGMLLPAESLATLTLSTVPRRRANAAVNGEGQPVTQTLTLSFARAVRFAVDSLPEASSHYRKRIGPVTVLTGRHTTASLVQASLREVLLREALVFYVPPTELDSAAEAATLRTLLATTNVLIVPNEDSATFARRRAARAGRAPVIVPEYLDATRGIRHWAAYVEPGAVAEFLATAGLPLAQVRADTTPKVRELRSLTVQVALPLAARGDSTAGTSVYGIIEGSDSFQRAQYVLLAAHLDQHDSVHASVDDNTASVAGLLALAKAFTQRGARPRRSIVFLVVDGGRKGFAGANFFTQNSERLGAGWMESIALNVTLDMIGRRAGDTLAIAGLEDLAFATPPNWVAAAHPELGLTMVDGGSVVSPTSDQYPFVAQAVPSLLFANGTHAASDTGAAAGQDGLSALDLEHEARILRLAFYVAEEAASARSWPRWTESGRLQRKLAFGE